MSFAFDGLATDKKGAAAAEMALVLPFLTVMLFGSFELGKYFMDAHRAQQAVRDGARYAGRQGFVDMPCGGPAANEPAINNLVRTGTTAPGGTPRLSYWTNPATITVTITCSTGQTYSSAGIYAAATGGARRVTVNATIPYTTLFGFRLSGANINAQSESAVMGI
jgi:Flp pilus assembly protein TadG